jgi:capsular polysaccharide biosynthesis protein
MENQQDNQEEEVDLRKYVKVIIKRKRIILSVFLISVIISIIAALKMPKVYEINSTIQLGSINELLIKKEEAKAIMLNQNSLLTITNALGLKTSIESLQESIKISDITGTNLLKIKITHSDVDTAIKMNEAITKPLITQGQAIYQEHLIIVKERLDELDAEIKNAESDISRTQTLMSGLPSASNISQSDVSLRIILLQNTLPNYENNLSMLRGQRNDLKLLLSNSKNFSIFDPSIKPKNPLGTNKKQGVFVAGVLGLLLGVFLAFILEFWQKDKN